MRSISVIITTHGEGDLLLISVESCLQAVAKVEQMGVPVQKYIAMDRPNRETRRAVEKCHHSFTVIELDFGDQGLVRNYMVEQSSDDYIAFLDGDDLWSENWLTMSFSEACKQEDPLVLFPEFNWYFEGSNNILCQVDSSFEWFDIESLRGVNLWDALCFCSREIYLQIPFATRDIAGGYAFEDWNWNRRVYEANFLQRVVKDTIIFKRRRLGSQGAQAEKRSVIASPTDSCFYDYY